MCLASFLLAFQLLASTQHRHDLGTQESDCISCFVAGHLPSDIPALDLRAVAVTVATLVYCIVPPSTYDFTGALSFLIPHGQAPPASPAA